MKKQRLTKQDIKAALLSKLNQKRAVVIWLTALFIAAILFYIGYIALYLHRIDFEPHRFYTVSPVAVITIVPIILASLAVFLLRYYYLNLFMIKTNNFQIVEEKLCQKEKMLVDYYRHSEKENVLYFRSGKIATDEKTYSYSNVGDAFYLVILQPKKRPLCIYHTEYYEIDAA